MEIQEHQQVGLTLRTGTGGGPASGDTAQIGNTTQVFFYYIPTITTTQSVDILNFPSGAAWVNIGDSGSLTVGSNVNTGSNANSTGDIFFTVTGSGGSLTFAAGASAILGAGTVTYHVTGSSPNTITFNGGALGESGGTANIVNTSGNGTLAVNLDANGSPYTVTLNNLTLNSGTNNDTVSLGSNSTLLLAGTSSISGVISGSGNLIFNSGGSLTLSGINTYTGSTTVSAGSLILSTGGSIAGSSGVAISSGATFNISSTTSGASIQSVTGSGNINLGSKTLTLTPSSADIFSGAISGSGGNLIVATTGSSTLTLTGANTYSGSTTVSSGTLAVTGTGSIANSSLTVATSSTFDISGTSSGSTVLNFSGGGDVALGSQALTVDETSSTTFSGSLTGLGSLIKTGSGTLTLSGTNAYIGSTTVSAGILALSGSGSIAASSLTVDSGTTFDLSQTTSGATVRNVSGAGTVSIGSSSQTFLVNQTSSTAFSGVMEDGGIGGGTGANFVKAGSFTLTLSAEQAYTGSTTILDGTLALTGSGSISSSSPVITAPGATFDISGTTSGATTQNLTGEGTGKLGAKVLTINNTSSTVFSGSLEDGGVFGGTGGGLIKTGPEVFILSGISSYKGPTQVESGTLRVNGSIASDVVVASGATLGGSGTVQGNVTIAPMAYLTHGSTFTITGDANISGTIDLGDVISEIDVGGNLNLESGSVLEVFVNNAGNSALTAGGSVTIGSPSTVNFIASPSYDLINHQFVFLTSDSEDIIGQFSNVEINTRLINSVLSYVDGKIIANYSLVDIPSIITEANASHVGASLKEILLSRNSAFGGVFESLFSLDRDELTTALNAMQPALLKALAISSENNVIKVHDSLGLRFQQELDQVHCFNFKEDTGQKESSTCQRGNEPLHVWVNGFGDILRQKSINYRGSSQLGYQTHTGGVTLGLDGRFADYFYLGALGAYTGSDVDWVNSLGSADISTGYGGIYFSALGDLFYVNTAVVGGWSHYHTKRDIVYPGTYQVAKSNHGGNQILSHLDTGLNFGMAGVSIRLFDAFDYISQTEQGFTETGAGAFNLKVKKSNAIMLRNELGLQLGSCFCLNSTKWTLSPKISWVREVRIKGSQYTANFTEADVPFTVMGYFPDRSLVSPGVMLTGVMWKDRLTMDLYYNGEFGQKYSDHNYGGQLRIGF